MLGEMRLRALCFGLLVLAALGASVSASDLDPVERERRLGAGLGGHGRIEGTTTRRLLHFTFDDGPDPRTTPRLLDQLDRHGVKATFFFSASRFRDGLKRHAGDAELAREVLRRGHMVGSHSVDHQRMAKLGRAALQEQLDLNDRLFLEVFGARTFLFRPPFGSSNAHLDAMLAERGYTFVAWNLGIADWVQRPPDRLALTFRKVLERSELEPDGRGGGVLLHDTHAWTLDAFELILGYVEARNCALLARGEELFDITDDLTPFIGDGLAPEVLAKRQGRLRERYANKCR
jgi:peptidoglycan/xylan/chitin deacetylase (PgdA/CDA1 family)